MVELGMSYSYKNTYRKEEELTKSKKSGILWLLQTIYQVLLSDLSLISINCLFETVILAGFYFFPFFGLGNKYGKLIYF